MRTVYVLFATLLLSSMTTPTSAKVGTEEKNLNENLHCTSDTEEDDLESENSKPIIIQNSESSMKTHPRLEAAAERSPAGRMELVDENKRSLDEIADFELRNSQKNLKRQVGVVYRDERPIGILQPYQRSYRFIPVKEEAAFGSYDPNLLEDAPYSSSANTFPFKREIKSYSSQFGHHGPNFRESSNYPSILANFRIGAKLDKKMSAGNNDAVVAEDESSAPVVTDEDKVQNLKSTIRKLRSSRNNNNQQIEEDLKSILDDMGLMEQPEKREALLDSDKTDEDDSMAEEESLTGEERSKRDDACPKNTESSNSPDQPLASVEEKKVEGDLETKATAAKRQSDDEAMAPDKKEAEQKPASRKKRQKEEGTPVAKENSQLVEDLKDSGDLMVSGNKSPLASTSEIVERGASRKEQYNDDEDEDQGYEKRVERQIQSKINSLKEEVKRELAALRRSQSEEEDRRRKRQIPETLIESETDDVDPVSHPEREDLKPLIRKRRSLEPLTGKRKKRRAVLGHSEPAQKQASKSEESDEGGLLGGDMDEGGAQAVNRRDSDYLEAARNKRSHFDHLELYDQNPFYDEGGRRKRQEHDQDLQDEGVGSYYRLLHRPKAYRSARLRRRIDNAALENRPQQLSDMSDLDLFGALPKSYDGELSRYKRVKRK